MAIDPKLKAKAVNEVVSGGKTYKQVADKYGTNERTVERWVNGKGTENVRPAERKLNAYHKALEEFALSALKMLNAQAELLSDPGYLVKQDTDKIVTHTRFIHERLLKHIELERTIQSPQSALPEPEPEQVEAELVEEVA